MPISTTDVGVAVFSLTLKSSVKMAKLKISCLVSDARY